MSVAVSVSVFFFAGFLDSVLGVASYSSEREGITSPRSSVLEFSFLDSSFFDDSFLDWSFFDSSFLELLLFEEVLLSDFVSVSEALSIVVSEEVETIDELDTTKVSVVLNS